MSASDFDLIVVGSGFAGSLLAWIATRLGLSVVLVEKAAHPRFAIGESSSPLANVLLEQLVERYGLEALRPFSAWGSWRAAHPEVDCGLKRGFTFFGHRPGEPFRRRGDRANELVVAASPRDEIGDTHWNRADFDLFVVREAQRSGARLLERTTLDIFRRDGAGVLVEGRREARRIRLRARLLIDASGPRGFLFRTLPLRDEGFEFLPASTSLYTHFSGVRRLETLTPFASSGTPPYPIDDAAVHHVFEGGWIWVLRFQSGITSAGVSAAPALAARLRLEEGEPAWRRLLEELPAVAEQFAGSSAIRPFAHAGVIPFRADLAAGAGWVMLPSAVASVDPMLSTGIPLTLLGVERIAAALETSWGSDDLPSRLGEIGKQSLAEADRAALLVSALSVTYGDFELFSAMTLLYFAAASHAEIRRRLDPAAPVSFLMGDHPQFGPDLESICRSVMEASRRGGLAVVRGRLLSRVFQAIEPLDIAGLSDRGRRHWHPVTAEPLLAAAHKVGADAARIGEMLDRTGFYSSRKPTKAEAAS